MKTGHIRSLLSTISIGTRRALIPVLQASIREYHLELFTFEVLKFRTMHWVKFWMYEMTTIIPSYFQDLFKGEENDGAAT